MPRTSLRLLAITTLLSVAAPEMHGQEILALGLSGDLQSIDPDTGQVSFIGFTAVHYTFWSAMAQDSQGRLYASIGDYATPYAIYELDPMTGQGTFVVQTSLYGLSAMAFDANDVLYVANDRTAPLGIRPMDLYTLDLGTGVEHLIGFTGVYNMLAIDFDQGVLYGYPANLGLVTIDTVTGVAADVNPNFRGPNGATVSMCFDDEGSLYYVDGVLWIVDAETGVFSIVDWANPSGFWGEAVFVEGPSPKFSLWLSGMTGGPVRIKIAGATPGGQLAVALALGAGGPTQVPAGFSCAGTTLRLNNTMTLLQVGTADADGKAVLGPQHVPYGAVGVARVQAVDMTTCTTSNRAIVSY